MLRRTLRDYLPAYFSIGSGQAANNQRQISPQLDVVVYDHVVFPHLAVNEDDTVVVCCEALYGVIECKASWDRGRVKEHFDGFATVEALRHDNYLHRDSPASYSAVVFDACNPDTGVLSADFGDESRMVGVYSVSGATSWCSPCGSTEFTAQAGNGLALLLKNLLLDSMRKGSKDEGTFEGAYEALASYFQ